VAGLALEGRWILRLLAAPSFVEAYKALPWVALGWAMYGLWVVFLAVAGRAKVTGRNFPAAIAGLAANVILLLVLVPALGLAGAGLALCGAYVVMLGVMHLLTRHAFPVAFEWRRLVQLVIVVGGLAAAGELALPTSGAVGFISRAVVWALIPLVLLATGFAHGAELRQARVLLARLRALGPAGPAGSES
jgi:O-antigen/teichoic acid export membrane protein